MAILLDDVLGGGEIQPQSQGISLDDILGGTEQPIEQKQVVDPTAPKIGFSERLRLGTQSRTGVDNSESAMGAIASVAEQASLGTAPLMQKVQELSLKDLAKGSKRTLFRGDVPYSEMADHELTRSAIGAGIHFPFTDSPLSYWDKNEGTKFKDDAERKQARSAYVQGLAQEVLKDRMQKQQEAGQQLDTRDKTLGAKIGAGGLENIGYMSTYMLGAPAAIGASAAGRFGDVTSDKLSLDQEGNIQVSAKADGMAYGAGKAVVGGAAEYAVERYLEKPLGWLGEKVAKLPIIREGIKSAVNTKAGKIATTTLDTFNRISKYTGVQTLPVEVSEEWVQSLADDYIGFGNRGDEVGKSFSQVNSDFVKQAPDIIYSMLLIQGTQAGTAAARDYHQYAMESNRVDGTLKAFGATDEQLKGKSLDDKQNMYRVLEKQLTPEKANKMLRRLGNKAQDVYDSITQQEGWDFKAKESNVKPTFTLPDRGLSVGELYKDEASGVSLLQSTPDTVTVVNRDGNIAGSYPVRDAIEAANVLSVRNQMQDSERSNKAEFIQRTAKRISGDIDVAAYNTMDEALKANPEIAKMPDFDKSSTGFLDKGKITIILDNIKTPFDAVNTILHEGGVHAGLRNILQGKGELNQFLGNISAPEVESFKDFVAKSGYISSDNVRSEEALAYMYENRIGNPTGYQKAVSWLHDKIRKVNKNFAFTDSDIEVMMAAAHNSVTGDRGNFARVMPEPAQNTALDLTASRLGALDEQDAMVSREQPANTQDETAPYVGAEPQEQEPVQSAPQSQVEQTAVTMPTEQTAPAETTPAQATAKTTPISSAVTPTGDNATLNQVATPRETNGKGIADDQKTDEPPAKATFLLNKDGSREYNTVELPIEELTLSKEVDQFKEGANTETGEVEPLQSEKYERVGTAPIVVWERNDGRKEVITGRHRLALARRLGEKTIPSQIVKESEGWTKTDAAALDAESNIRDGQGSVKDYARYFKYAKLDQKTADSRGLLSRKRGQYGYIIGTSASNDLFANYSAGEIGDEKAYEIARVAPNNDEAQRVGYTYAKTHTAEDTAQYMRSIISQKREQESGGSTLDLFGNDDSWMKRAEAEAKAAATILRGMNDEIGALKAARSLSVDKRKTMLSKYGVNAGDTNAINKRLETLEGQRDRFDNWHLNPDLAEMVRNSVDGVKKEKPFVATAPKASTPAMELESATPEQIKAEAKKRNEQSEIKRRLEAIPTDNQTAAELDAPQLDLGGDAAPMDLFGAANVVKQPVVTAQTDKAPSVSTPDVTNMSYNELVQATEKGIEARRKLSDLPPRLRSDIEAAQKDGVDRTEDAVIKWLADKRGTLTYKGSGTATDIIKNLPLQDANVLDMEAGKELNSREQQRKTTATPPEPRTKVKAPIDNVSDAKKARAAELITRMNKRTGRLNAGLDPESLIDGIELASIYIEGGVKTFAQFARAMKEASEELYGKIKDHLITIWTGAQADNAGIEELTRTQAKAVIDAVDAESSTSKSNVAQAAELMAQAINDGQLTRLQASKIMADVYGGTDAEGKYSSKDTTDVAELAVNMIIRDSKDYPTNVSSEKAIQVVNALKEFISRMPTQTTRTAETDKMQQFSTPPPLAYVVNWVASIKNTDTVIEPSAGIGGIAVFAHNAGADVITNELSDRRAAILKELGISDASFSLNAEYLNALLDPKISKGEINRPTVVVMNPPFSNSANTDKSSTIIGGKHIEEALSLLEEGGRLVAIVGEGMAANKPRLAGWWKKIGQTYSVRANIGVNGEEYRKYGTTFGNQIIVIDKTGPTKEGSTIVGNVNSIEELPLILKEVQNERANLEQSSSEPSGINTAEDTGAGNPKGSGLSSSTGGLQSGRPGQGASTAGRPTKNGNGKPSVQKPRGSAQGGKKDGAVSDTSRGQNDAAGRDSGLDSGPAIEGLELKTKSAESKVVAEDEVFTSYSPSKAIVEGSQKHPTPLVESSAMASVDAPDVNYSPKLPKQVITGGILSDAQIETVVYAGQAHQNILPDGSRMGYFIGDGTGVGKGREIAGIITDNWNNGRKKAVWVSKKAELINDAERDLTALGVKAPLIDMSKNGGNALLDAGNGVAFVPYTSLARDNPGVANDSNQLKTAKDSSKKKSRIERLRDWLGADFDGVIAFDEVHLAGNAIDIKGKRGVKKASKNGMAVVDLQKIFPKARVVYVSATGATEISNLAYGDRLGIWGPGTPFANKQSFFNKISAGGMSSMEIVARDLKAMGRYIARTLSFKGVDNEQITHTLTEDQKRKYDEASKAWQLVFQNIDATMARTGANNNGKARGSALSKFYGAQQRFYNQLLTSLQMPSVIVDAKKSLANGESVVFQIVNTNEAALGRELTSSAEEEDFDPNDIDLSPMSVLLQYVESCYPTALYQETQDDNGNAKWEVVIDGEGNPVQDPQAVRERDSLIDRLSRMRMPGNPLELILDTFGVDNVAEVTGRSQRVVKKPDASGQITTQIEKGRSSRHAIADTKDFNSGKKRVLVFSDAGGTGFSYHAGSNFKNQQRRIHYLIQAGWRADAALQGFGRTHRSDQVSAPFYKLVSTDIKGHKRFISTIARRLSQLGSLTSGDRSAAGSGVLGSEDNLENDYAQDSLDSLFIAIFQGKVSGFNLNSLAKKMGFSKTVIDSKTGEQTTVNTLIDPETGSLNDTKLPTVPQFLNRILMLEVDEQNGLFDEFMDRMNTRIENAKLDGSYDPGLQTLKAAEIRKVAEDVVYEQPDTSAKTKIIDVDVDHKVTRIPFSKVQSMQGGMFVKNNKSGHVYALFHGPGRTEESGRVIETWRRIGPHNTDIVPKYDVQAWYGGNYTEIKDQAEAKLVWDEQYDNSPKVRTERQSYIAGAFLPVWDRIGIERPQIWRVTPKGEGSFLGARIPSKMVADVRRKMGAGKGSKLSADNVLSSVLDGGQSYDMANGWRLKRSVVLGERRIEVVGIEEDSQIREFVNFIGGFSEKIGWTTRCFIPTDVDQGVKSLEKLLKKSPIIEDEGDTASDQMDATRFRRAVTTEQDMAYMAAVERGDTETAQKMVDDAAKAAGYNVGPVWHAGPEAFNVFKRRYERDGVNSASEASRIQRYGKGIFFSSDENVAKNFGSINRRFFLRMDYPIEQNLGGANYYDGTLHDPETGEPYLGDDGKPIRVDQSHLPDEAAELHLDDTGKIDTGVIVRGVYESIPSKGNPKPMSDIYIVGNPNQIKSADAITRDDAGNVIPLSERFNEATADTRFRRGVSPREDAQKRYVRATPSTNADARQMQYEVETSYAYNLTPTTVQEAVDKAQGAYNADKTQAQMDLLAGKQDSGDVNTDAERMAVDKIATDDLTMEAVSDPKNESKVATAMLGIWRWYERGTDVARALQLRIDPVNTPEGRRAWILRTIFAPTNTEAEIIRRAESTKDAVEKLKGRAKYASKVLDALKRKDMDVSTLTADQLMDDVFVAKLLQEIATIRSGWGDMVHEYWRNAILSAPTTQIVNAVGNAGHAALEAFVQRPVEAMMNVIVKDPDAATFNSINAMYKAIAPSIQQANKAFLQAWKTEKNVTGPGSSKLEESDAAIKGMPGKVIRVPQRIMSATDEWFKTVFMSMLTADYATREFDKLVSEGKQKESNRAGYISAQINPKSSAYAEAWQETLRWSFQQKPGRMAASIMHWRNDPKFGFMLKFIFPFVKTPANIIRTGLRKTPAHALPYMYNLWKGNYSKSDAMRLGAEQAVGMVLMMSIYAMMKGDDDDELNRPRITGSRKSSANSPKGSKEAEAQNAPPMSIRIGDKWVSYARLEPIATMVSTMIDALSLWDQAQKGQFSDMPETIFASVRGNLADKTFLQGVGNLVSIIEGDEIALQKAVTSTLAGFNPNIIRSTARAFDPYIRDMKNRDKGTEHLKTAAERFGQSVLPSAGVAPIPKMDRTGKPIEREGGGLYNAVVPFKLQDATKTTKVDAMVKRWNDKADSGDRWWPSTPEPEKAKVGKEEIAMSPEEYVEYQKIVGQIATRILDRQSFNYENPSERDILKLKKIYEEARKAGRERIRPQMVKRWRSEQGR